jgi:ribosomal protein L32
MLNVNIIQEGESSLSSPLTDVDSFPLLDADNDPGRQGRRGRPAGKKNKAIPLQKTTPKRRMTLRSSDYDLERVIMQSPTKSMKIIPARTQMPTSMESHQDKHAQVKPKKGERFILHALCTTCPLMTDMQICYTELRSRD